MRPCNTGLGDEQASDWKRDGPQTEIMNACDVICVVTRVIIACV